jgi:hypothetical protein
MDMEESKFEARLLAILSDNRVHKTKDLAFILDADEGRILEVLRNDVKEIKFSEPECCLKTRAEIVEPTYYADDSDLRVGSIKQGVYDCVNQSEDPIDAKSVAVKMKMTTEPEIAYMRSLLSQLFKADKIARFKRGLYVRKGYKVELGEWV